MWSMLPTSLNYYLHYPTPVEGCYSEDHTRSYKPHVLLNLVSLAQRYQLVAILPLLHYCIAQWPVDWITYGVPPSFMGFDPPFNNSCLRLPPDLVYTIIAGREKLIRMRETWVFNFMEAFTSNGTAVDIPIEGCDGERRQGETCFKWLMQVWFHMGRFGFIARPAALDIMNMNQWAYFKENCCKACARRAISHMLIGRDDVWDALPSVFGYHDWTDVIERQRKVEEAFETVIS